MDHAATRKVDDQSRWRQYDPALFKRRGGQINEEPRVHASLKGQLVLKRELILFQQVATRLGAAAVSTATSLRHKIQRGPMARRQQQNARDCSTIAIANVGLQPPSPLDCNCVRVGWHERWHTREFTSRAVRDLTN